MLSFGMELLKRPEIKFWGLSFKRIGCGIITYKLGSASLRAKSKSDEICAELRSICDTSGGYADLPLEEACRIVREKLGE